MSDGERLTAQEWIDCLNVRCELCERPDMMPFGVKHFGSLCMRHAGKLVRFYERNKQAIESHADSLEAFDFTGW